MKLNGRRFIFLCLKVLSLCSHFRSHYRLSIELHIIIKRCYPLGVTTTQPKSQNF